MIEKVEYLKSNMFSTDWELVKESSKQLGELGGKEITDLKIAISE